MFIYILNDSLPFLNSVHILTYFAKVKHHIFLVQNLMKYSQHLKTKHFLLIIILHLCKTAALKYLVPIKQIRHKI